MTGLFFRLVLFVAIMVATAPSSGRAQSVTLHGDDSGITVFNGYQGLLEMRKLSESHYDFKQHPEVWQPLIACVAADGDHAVVNSEAWLWAEVLVIDGAHAGCRGFVSAPPGGLR
jgi:hypothetical protein